MIDIITGWTRAARVEITVATCEATALRFYNQSPPLHHMTIGKTRVIKRD
jgi:hypothetical protein